MDVHRESDALRIIKLGPFGPYANNSYLVTDKATNESALIDAVPEADQILAAADGTRLTMVLFTHSHPDHIDTFEQLRALPDLRFYMHPDEPWADHSQIDVHLRGGETVRLGQTTFQVIHTPGHTPGGLCYYHAPFCIVGDTLFPGGPGHTRSNADLQTLITSITDQLHPLPEETTIFAGHGDDTTIGSSRQEYAAFAAQTHDPDLHGDVLWKPE